MNRNIEVKIKISDFNSTWNKLIILKNENNILYMGLLYQTDTYFQSKNGRLKIREINNNETNEIIWYNRENNKNAKLSEYIKLPIENKDIEEYKYILSKSNNVIGVVRNKRHLFIYQQTRIHFDYVEKLGSFLELEYVLKDYEKTIDGQNAVKNILTMLGLDHEIKIEGSYIDLIINELCKNNFTNK